jgi:8-oxo-dGTP pyrophosphatase MutT (NUDIX family)
MQDLTLTEIRGALAAGPRKLSADSSLTPAGVMVLLYLKLGEYQLLLNRRSRSVQEHKGEISFPGGRMDGGDGTLLRTALRETHEEMGVRPEDIVVLGELDDVATRSSYRVSPFVGTIPEGYRFRPNAREVAEVLEVPLVALGHGDAVRHEVRMVDGSPVQFRCYAYDGNVIWGATARILQNLLRLLGDAQEGAAP